MPDLELFDFELFSSDRLQTLLEDYQESLRHVRILYGTTDNDEYRTYDKWTQEIERVLDRRYAV